MNNSPQRAAKGFTRAFWVSNTVELFERMAYYAVFIVLTIYLSTILGFNDFSSPFLLEKTTIFLYHSKEQGFLNQMEIFVS